MPGAMGRYELRIELALLASLLLHAAAIGGWQGRQVLARVSERIHPSRPTSREEAVVPTITFVDVAEPVPAPAPMPAPAAKKTPRTFIETDPSQVTGEHPKEAELYSDKPTVAANPSNPTDKKDKTPFLEGTGTKVLSTENVPWNRGMRAALPAPFAPQPPATPAPEPPKEIAEQGLKQPEPKQVATVLPQDVPGAAVGEFQKRTYTLLLTRSEEYGMGNTSR
jgi:hypothetical protein